MDTSLVHQYLESLDLHEAGINTVYPESFETYSESTDFNGDGAHTPSEDSAESEKLEKPATLFDRYFNSMDLDDAELDSEGRDPLQQRLGTLYTIASFLDASLDTASRVFMKFLMQHEPEFVRYASYRYQRWANTHLGDELFVGDTESVFTMQRSIARQINERTGVLELRGPAGFQPKVLDLCMGPGGFSYYIKGHNPRAKMFAIAQPSELGGHEVLMKRNDLVGIEFLDVTMLAVEIGGIPPPEHHPYSGSFLDMTPFAQFQMDLVICGGLPPPVVPRDLLRVEYAHYREDFANIRLITSQLILGIFRLRRDGKGTLVILLDKIHDWASLYIMYLMEKFATVRTFKPERKDQARSSFYLIATKVDIRSEACHAAVDIWTSDYLRATYGGPKQVGADQPQPPIKLVHQVLDEFGGRLAFLGKDIWKLQADAMAKLHADGATTAEKYHLTPDNKAFMYECAGRDPADVDKSSFEEMWDRKLRDVTLQPGHVPYKKPVRKPKPLKPMEWKPNMTAGEYREYRQSHGTDTSSWITPAEQEAKDKKKQEAKRLSMSDVVKQAFPDADDGGRGYCLSGRGRPTGSDSNIYLDCFNNVRRRRRGEVFTL